MSRFGLIGNPILHSKSPVLFQAAYGNSGHTYSLFQTETAEQALELFNQKNIKGVNVTSPFKERVMDFVTLPDRISFLSGSANVLIKGNRKNEILSYNTDYYGVKCSVEEFFNKEEFICTGVTCGEKDGRRYCGRVAVVGAGGAGRAAALAMCDLGFEVTIVNRTAGKVSEFADSIGAVYAPLEKLHRVVYDSDIVIYALAFPLSGLESIDYGGKIIFEANYAAPSLARVVERGAAIYIDGRYWLYHQAVPAFQLFTGEEPNKLEMRKVMGLE